MIQEALYNILNITANISEETNGSNNSLQFVIYNFSNIPTEISNVKSNLDDLNEMKIFLKYWLISASIVLFILFLILLIPIFYVHKKISKMNKIELKFNEFIKHIDEANNTTLISKLASKENNQL